MKEFILKSRQISPSRLQATDTCRICDMAGIKSEITHCVELVSDDDRKVHILFALTCDAHTRHAINDVLTEAAAPWRAYVEPTERVRSNATHEIARRILELSADLRNDPGNRGTAADQLRSLAVRVHGAARFLEHYESSNGGNDDE